MESIKLNSEEIEKIKSFETQYFSSITKMGQLKAEQILASQNLNRLNTLEKEFENQYLFLQKEEDEFAQELTKKYGNGYVNLETGEFIKQ